MSWVAIKWARKQRAGSPITKAVLTNLALHADEKGFCWPAQETMAREIECSVDSVQRALKKLEGRVLWRIKRKSSDGRRISDAYQLRLDREPEQPQSNPSGPAPCGPADDGRQAAGSPAAEPQADASPGGTVRPKYLEEEIQESSHRLLRNTLGGGRLEKRLGKVVFNSWFGKVFYVGQKDQILLLRVANRFIAGRIEQQFEHAVIQCFQPEHQVVRVRVLVRKDATATEGATENLNEPGRGPAP